MVYYLLKAPREMDNIDIKNLHNKYKQQWYKRVYTIPSQLKGLSKIIRRIGHDLYWPLTELDLLNEFTSAGSGRSFVSSQTTTIFDNLANQTFTVVSSLQLSQYNDKSEHIEANSLPIGNFNLYACIVDADVRHNFATLGVHLRETPRKIPFEISQRLRARSILTKSQKFSSLSNEPLIAESKQLPIELKSYPNYDSIRESHLQCK